MKWLFSKSELDAAAGFHDENGFVGVSDLLSGEEFLDVTSAVDGAMAAGRLTIDDEEMPNNNDCVYADPRIEAAAKNPAALPGVACFPDGVRVELRGLGGRLFDVAGKLAPDRVAAKHPSQGRAAGY